MEEILRLAKEKLAPNISKDLKKYKEEISDILQDEIVSRYYFQKGRKENSFGSDPFLKKAIEILKNEKEYNLILKNWKMHSSGFHWISVRGKKQKINYLPTDLINFVLCP